MHGMFVVVFVIHLKHIQTENITLNPGDENLHSIFAGDTLTLQCPVNSSEGVDVRWSYVMGTIESILSIGKKLNAANFLFSVDFTNHLQTVTYLRIYNITPKEQHIYKCYYRFKESSKDPFTFDYNIQLANITNTLVMNSHGSVCCEVHVHGRNISSNKFIWEQRTLYGEHIRFFESDPRKDSGTFKRDENLKSCLNFNENGIIKYDKEGEYICNAQFFIYGRNQMVDKTTTIKLENIKDRPVCIQRTRYQHSTIGTNIIIAMNVYSKPVYSALSLRKNDSELDIGDDNVKIKNVSLDVYNVTITVSGYEIIINITEFSEEDVGNYTVKITNEFGSCNCTVQLLSQGNNHTEEVVIGETKRAELTKSLLWYIVACGSIIVVLFTMSALRSSFLKTVDTCSKPTIRKPSCHKSTEKKATKKQAAKKPRRAYSDQFMEVTFNQLNDGERILIIGQTNEMDASTETNI